MKIAQNLAIHVDHLIKRFGNTIAVDDISFEVERGEIFAFLGPNGAGKTTTIKILTTLLQPTSGMVSINSFNPRSEKDAVRRSFGIVFQDPSLDDELTAYENMDFHGILYDVPTQLRKNRIKELMELVELWVKKDQLVKTFSGGMKRRLEIARGLIHHPNIFFLDEPTIGLDPQTRNSIWQYILNLNKSENITIFFTTHYMDEAERIAKRIAIIDHGKIVALGTTEDLKRQTKTKTLETAFLSITGKTIREEQAGANDQMRVRHRLWSR